MHLQAPTALGSATLDRGAPQQASVLLEEALGLWMGVGNRWGVACARHALGRVAHAEQDQDAALASFEESRAMRAAFGDRRGQAESLEAIALIETARGQLKAGVDHLLEAATLRSAAGAPVPPNRRAEIQHMARVLQARVGARIFMQT